MITKKILATILIILSGCSGNTDDVSFKIEQQINGLKTLEDRREFLNKILKDDQKVRDGKDSELMLKYGKDSKEHMEYIQAQWRQDEVNLIKVEKYLEKFSYPSKTQLGKDAAMVPWLVIHHSTDPQIRNRNFDALYKAYLREDIDNTAMSMYLGRTYEFTYGERFRIESPYKAEDEINQLIKKLNLETKKVKAQ